MTEPDEKGRRYRHGTLTAYNAGKCRCEHCRGAYASYRARRRAQGKDEAGIHHPRRAPEHHGAAEMTKARLGKAALLACWVCLDHESDEPVLLVLVRRYVGPVRPRAAAPRVVRVGGCAGGASTLALGGQCAGPGPDMPGAPVAKLGAEDTHVTAVRHGCGGGFAQRIQRAYQDVQRLHVATIRSG